ncbi:MAG: DUF222 domain-containing protein [Micropruina sp.]|uniref:HNH endonuclease n=1 Tax=Micropruina sp. TaxID=2737536 RepID=UPI0039E5FBA8
MEKLTADMLRGLVPGVAEVSLAADAAGLIDQLRSLEQLKSACAAAQARVTVAFKRLQVAEHEAAGVPADRRGKDVAAQVALARKESPRNGSRLVSVADALMSGMPHTMAALAAGELSEWRATLVVKETACLTREHRQQVDAELAGRLGELSDRALVAEARKVAYRLDPYSFVERARKAEADRCVSLRPAPDCMTRLSALLPVAQGVAAFAALTQAADAARSAGDGRGKGQLMADTLVERVTGRASAADIDVEIQLIMSDQTLFGGGSDDADEAAVVTGHGPIPAPLARRMVHDLPDGARTWIRRLYTEPDSGRLVAMESTARLFPTGLRRFLVARDRYCRTPWCGAPIRHADHVIPHQVGGATSAANGQGLCEACNQIKTMPGWQSRPVPEGAGDAVATVTPTGHAYQSRPPRPPGSRRKRGYPVADFYLPPPVDSPLERRLRRILAA